jgi:adenylate kinase
MRIVILGAPGSGKRTQTDLVSNKYGLSPVMTGELVKTAVLEKSPLGLEIKELQDAGRVVTEDIVLALLRERLLRRELRDGFILDGFPRNLLQALTLDELMIEIGQPLDLVLLIDIETDNLMERLVGRRSCRSCGLLYNIYRNPTAVDGVCDVCGGRLHQRSDDNEETVSSRVHVFDHLISPLITHYEKQGKLVIIDGNGEVEEVFRHICKAIDAGAPSAPQQSPPEREPAAKADQDGQVPRVTTSPPGTGSDPQPVKPGHIEAPAEEESAASAGHPRKTTKKGSIPNKSSNKKSAQKKQAKKKASPEKRSGKRQSSTKGPEKQALNKAAQKRPASKPKIKKKATATKPVKKSDKALSGRSPAGTGQAKRAKTKAKQHPLKQGEASAAKVSGGKPKTAAKQANRVVRKKPVVKKTVKKKAVVKKSIPKAAKATPKKKGIRK